MFAMRLRSEASLWARVYVQVHCVQATQRFVLALLRPLNAAGPLLAAAANSGGLSPMELAEKVPPCSPNEAVARSATASESVEDNIQMALAVNGSQLRQRSQQSSLFRLLSAGKIWNPKGRGFVTAHLCTRFAIGIDDWKKGQKASFIFFGQFESPLLIKFSLL